MIKFNCESCGQRFEVAEKFAGRLAKCKSCSGELCVPRSNQTISTNADTTNTLPPPLPSRKLAKSQQASEEIFRGENLKQTGESSRFSDRTEKAVVDSITEAVTESPKKLPVRLRRLRADAEQTRKAFENFGPIRVQSSVGAPPDSYVINYRIKSLARGHGGDPIPRDDHRVEIQLTRDYPHHSPKCRMLTPVFHPNIEPAIICVGDHWTAAERLTDLVIRIGEMLAYQAFNIKSPLDGDAAMWADLHRDQLPIDKSDLRPPNLL